MTQKIEDLLSEVLHRNDLGADRRDVLIDVTAFYGRLTDTQRQRVIANLVLLMWHHQPETSCQVMMRFAEFVKGSEIPHDPLQMGILIGQFIMADKK